MPNTSSDEVATALAGAAVAIYLGFLVFGSLPLVQDVRGMAAVGLILGLASRRIGGRHGFRHERFAMVANFGSLALGFTALFTESAIVLALFMLSIAGLGLAATYVRTGGPRMGRLRPSH
jgi:hypothetical protein